MKFRTINIGFTYDVDGLRTSKTVHNVDLEHKYYYVGNRLQYETISDSSALWYFYDADGNPSGIRYKDNSGTVNDYYFVCNWRGDVIQIYNASGTLVGSYTYDAWGKVTENATSADTQNITETNPIRYRGYYYDTETRLYYLKSRYYDPAVKRFLNADSMTDGATKIHGTNLFIYVGNDPVNNSDDSGQGRIKNAIKWIVKKVLRPVVKHIQKRISKRSFTYSRGVNASATPGIFAFNIQGGVSIDSKGNVAFQGGFSGGVTIGSPGASIMAYSLRTNAPDAIDLEGLGYQIGGSFSAGVTVGFDFNIIPSSQKTYYGISENIGVGTPGAELHVVWGETRSLNKKYNVFDVAESVYVKIMEW